MVKLELVLMRSLGGLFPGSRFMSNFTEQCTILSQENLECNMEAADLPLRFWDALSNYTTMNGNIEEITNDKLNSERAYNTSNKILTSYKLVAATYPLKITSSNFWRFNAMELSKQKNVSVQPIATLKTYSYNNFRTRIRPQVPKSRQHNDNRNFFEKLKKLYRETIRIKTRKTIMKKKPFRLNNEDKEAMIDAYIRKKWNEAKIPINIDPALSNHLLKQAEKNKSADLNISLSCSQYPFIPCPLQTSESYVVANTCNYKHTSLAPLFTLDPIIINKDKKISSNQNKNIKRCISINFWNQFHSNNQIIKEEDNEVKLNILADENTEVLDIKTNSLPSQYSTQKEIEEKAPINLKPSTAVESVVEIPRVVEPSIVETPTVVETVNDKKEIISKPENIAKETSAIAVSKPENITKTRSVQSNSVNLRLSKTNVNDKVKKTNIFKHKFFYKENQTKYIKHLDLNFPNKMTSPNLIKTRIKPKNKLQDKLLSISDPKVINPLKENKVNIPKYTNNRLLKKIQKLYQQVDPPNNMQLELNDKNADNSQSNPNAFRGVKTHYPMTSPNNHKKK